MSTQIHDLGYRSYDGERLGTRWAVRSLAKHSVRRALGLKRAGKHKIVPIITIALAFLPAIIMTGLAAFLPVIEANDLLSYGDYIGVTGFAMFLFTAAAAPGVLTTDRTSGMLAMYLASPLTRTTYVFAKAIGIFTVMLLVTVGPIVFLVLAYTFIGEGPGGVFDFAETMGRAILAGALAAAFYTGLGMFISSLPKRWGIASVSIVAAIMIPPIVGFTLTEQGEASDYFALIAPSDAVAKAWQHILGDTSTADGSINGFAIDRIDGALVVTAAVVFTVALLGATWYRYQTLEVDR